MYSQYQAAGYNITEDSEFGNNQSKNTPELAEQLQELFLECRNPKSKRIIDRLAALIVQYPQSPQLKNYLSVAYTIQGNVKKAREINSKILIQHPDYLFGKLQLANEYITNGQPQKVPEVLGEAMELKKLYPDRELFHLSELTGFFKVIIRYYTAIKNLEQAENRFDLLQQIAPDHPDTETAQRMVSTLRLEKGLKMWEEDNANRISVTCAKPIPVAMNRIAPVFTHTEIRNLYEYGFDIPFDTIDTILALPRETLVGDLEKVLMDAVNRYPFFVDANLEPSKEYFPLHAIFLLGQLKAESSLQVMLYFLENNEKVLEYWLGDHLTETIWLPIYLMSQNNFALLQQFLLKPGIELFAKLAATKALTQMVFHQPAKRKEIGSIYNNVFSFCNQAKLEDNIIDSEWLGLLISDIIDCGFDEVLPVVKELFTKKRISVLSNGNYEDVIKEFKNPLDTFFKKDIINIYELYDDLRTNWIGDKDDNDLDEDFDNEDDFVDYEIQQPAVSVKIGRNEPCPCGSGKKYKKCCIDKLGL